MAVAEKNFCVVANDLFEFNLLFQDSAGNAIDLTGWTIRMDLRTSFDAASPSLQFAVGDGITVTTPASGLAEFAKIMALDAGDYVYDIQTNAGLGPKTHFRGQIKVVDEVTQGA